MTEDGTRLACLSYMLTELERETHLNFSALDFNSRLRAQKSVYLLKALGVSPFTEYDFGYYIRGPYSPALARDYYALTLKPLRGTRPNISDRNERIVIEAANRGNNFLEAVATLHFARLINKGMSEYEVLKTVRELKPGLSSKLPEAWEFLEENGLVRRWSIWIP